MELNLIAIHLKKNDVKDAAVTILSHDCDFSENEEYFREDTLELGFENEAERVGVELAEKYKEVCSELIEEICEYSTGGTQFIAGNGTYSDAYTFEVTEIDKNSVFL